MTHKPSPSEEFLISLFNVNGHTVQHVKIQDDSWSRYICPNCGKLLITRTDNSNWAYPAGFHPCGEDVVWYRDSYSALTAYLYETFGEAWT